MKAGEYCELLERIAVAGLVFLNEDSCDVYIPSSEVATELLGLPQTEQVCVCVCVCVCVWVVFFLFVHCCCLLTSLHSTANLPPR